MEMENNIEISNDFDSDIDQNMNEFLNEFDSKNEKKIIKKGGKKTKKRRNNALNDPYNNVYRPKMNREEMKALQYQKLFEKMELTETNFSEKSENSIQNLEKNEETSSRKSKILDTESNKEVLENTSVKASNSCNSSVVINEKYGLGGSENIFFYLYEYQQAQQEKKINSEQNKETKNENIANNELKTPSKLEETQKIQVSKLFYNKNIVFAESYFKKLKDCLEKISIKSDLNLSFITEFCNKYMSEEYQKTALDFNFPSI